MNRRGESTTDWGLILSVVVIIFALAACAILVGIALGFVLLRIGGYV